MKWWRLLPLSLIVFVTGTIAALFALCWWAWPSPPVVDHWAQIREGQDALERGQPVLALRAVGEIRDQGPGAAEAMTLAAKALLMQQQLPPARRLLERSLALEANQPEALKMLAAIALTYSDSARGRSLLLQAARLLPADFRPWYALGKVYLDRGEADEATQAYTEALRRQPPASEARVARIGLLRALLDAQHSDEAAVALKEMQSLPGLDRDPEVLVLAARLARDSGRDDEARTLADQALAADPDQVEALLLRAKLSHLAGREESALTDLDHVTSLRPDDLGALQLRSQVESRLGLRDQAAATTTAYQRASQRKILMDRLVKQISQRPDDPDLRWQLGQLATENGQTTLAYQCFQAALDVDPNFRPARRSLQALRASRP